MSNNVAHPAFGFTPSGRQSFFKAVNDKVLTPMQAGAAISILQTPNAFTNTLDECKVQVSVGETKFVEDLTCKARTRDYWTTGGM